MGKHKKRKRYRGSDRSRSRSRPRKHSSSGQSPRMDIEKLSPTYHKSLVSFSHRYYLSNQSKSIGLPYVVWDLCLRLGARPCQILIVCESMSHLATVQRACRLHRSIRVIDQTAHSRGLGELIKDKTEIIMTTQRKCSILIAVEQQQKMLDAIINISKCYDPQFYARLTDLAKDGASLITFADTASTIKKLSQSIGIQFQEMDPQPTQAQLQRQLISDIQMAPRPTFQTINLLRGLGISHEQIAGRLLQLDRCRREPPKSLHLSMPGYITYRLDMDVEFNSLKYVWNFLRQQFPRGLYEEVRGMHKYQNQKGVVFNIPEELRYVAEGVAEKLKRHKAKFKGIDLQQCSTLPPLEDTESEEYKLLREKKKNAMENKNDLEIFIGGVPYEMDEDTLKNFFKENGVTLFLVRILKDEKGFSKGIGFGLCESKEHFERALRLNGSRLMDRTIRVKLADQRKD